MSLSSGNDAHTASVYIHNICQLPKCQQNYSILIHTYHADSNLRKEAESALKEYLKVPGACMQLLMLIGDVSIHRDLRLSGSVLKVNPESWRCLLNHAKS